MKKFSIEYLSHRTAMQKSRVLDYGIITAKLVNDPDKEDRLKDQNCVCCYYIPTIAGQGFTDSNCANCDTKMTFSTTSTDKLCETCATKFDACKHCGADINYKTRYRL